MKWISILTICLMTAGALAQTEPSTEPTAAATTQNDATGADEKISVTHHTLTLGGAAINYQALAGTITAKDESGKPKADFFFVAYMKESGDKPANRPITFIFNGGPGAAAVWLHLGCVGPQRIALGSDGIPGAPPYKLIDNDQSWLDLSDLVFIDPVGTGYSRAAEGQAKSDFFGVQQDLESIGNFIRLFLTRYQRWGSPKFLAGESYGTTRAAALSELLLDHYGINLNGIVLISTVLNFQTIDTSGSNDLAYALYLPSYTAIALYHHKIQTADEDKLLAEVSNYATSDYLVALGKGGALDKDARADVVAHLARYTGLPPDLIDRADMRVDPDMFRKQLLADQRMIIGRFDARISGLDPNPAESEPDYDPSLSLFLPVYAGTFNDYVRSELNYKSDLDYRILTNDVWPWEYKADQFGSYLDVSKQLRSAMMENPHLKVLVCSGYEDLATPYLGTIYTLNHLDLLDRIQANVTQTFYHSGHMIYHDPASLKQLKANVATFFAAATRVGS